MAYGIREVQKEEQRKSLISVAVRGVRMRDEKGNYLRKEIKKRPEGKR